MIDDGKVLVLDVDGTLCPLKTAGQAYADVSPDPAVLGRLRRYREDGWYVIIQTARQMRTHDGNVGRINATTLPELIEWLRRHDVPHDEVHVAKPWPGHHGFYVDDRTVRPAEFLSLSPEEIEQRLDADRTQAP